MAHTRIIPTSRIWIFQLRIFICSIQVLAFLFLSAWSVPLSPYIIMTVFVLVTVITNLLVSKRFSTQGISEEIVFSLFCLDLLMLFVNLGFSGGAANPFSVFFLIYVIFSSLLLRPIFVWAITGLTISAFGILLVQPFSFLSSENTAEMQHHAHAHGEMHSDNNDAFSSHLLGMWLAYSITSIFSAYFVTSLGAQLKKVIEDREVLKQSQLRLNSMVRLAAGAAHELSTPLNTIRLILDDLPNEDGELDIIKSQTIRCTEIIKRLNPAELDSTNLDLEEVEISEMFNEIITDHKRLDQTNLIISTIDSSCTKFSLPKNSLNSILKNLITNAAYANNEASIKNMITDKTIKLSFKDLKDQIEFMVEDLGGGFDPVILNKVGEPFITTKKTGSGLGLGLFIVDLTVKRFGGSLIIDSKQNSGSTVKVKFNYPIRLQTL